MDPVAVSGYLLAEGLIPYNLHNRLVYSTGTPRDKAQQLVATITECIHNNSSAFDVFIAVLKTQGGWTEQLVSMLRSVYSKKRL